MLSINHLNERVAGWQRDLIHNDLRKQETPFLAIKNLSSTRGRLILVQNWEKNNYTSEFFISKTAEGFIWNQHK